MGIVRHAFGGPVGEARLSLRPLGDRQGRRGIGERTARQPRALPTGSVHEPRALQEASSAPHETARDGRFAVPLEDGEYELLVRASGFRPLLRRVQVPGRSLDLVLERSPILLGALGRSSDEPQRCDRLRVRIAERRPDESLRAALRAHEELARALEKARRDAPRTAGPGRGENDERGAPSGDEASEEANDVESGSDLADDTDGEPDDQADGDPGDEPPLGGVTAGRYSWALLDSECRFQHRLSGMAGEVQVSVVGGEPAEAIVSVPPTGDPIPLCLGEACAPAALPIAWYVSGGGGSERFLLQGGSLTSQGSGTGWGSSHGYAAPVWDELSIAEPGSAALSINWRRAGRRGRVSGGAGELQQQLLLRPGINDVVLSLGP